MLNPVTLITGANTPAKGESYSCSVGENTKMPFMIISDAIRAILIFMDTPQDSLRKIAFKP